MAPMSLPPGFRFHPTDEELVAYYLDRKITGRTIELEIIPEVDIYKCEPWDLPDKSFLPSKDMEWYFYSPRDKKYPNGSRTNRATRAGYWKATGKDRAVNYQKRPLGMKKTLVYYKGRAPHGIRTNWVMHEYRLIYSLCGSASSALMDSYALCRVFKKTVVQLSKTKEDQKMGNIADDDHDQMDHTMSVSDDQQLITDPDDASSSKGREGELDDDADDNFNKEFSKFQQDTSSSDVTQGGTPLINDLGTRLADDDHDMQLAQFTLSDEANSSANIVSSFRMMDFSSNLFQEVQMPEYSSSRTYHQLQYPPLKLEDFPQINITKPSMSKIMDDYSMIYDNEYKNAMNGTLDEIFSLCSSQDYSNIALSSTLNEY